MREKKHDGKLPAMGRLSTDGEVRWSGSFVFIRCGRNTVMLDPVQARSLLAWLRQQPDLEQSTKEQQP